jgi:hypothetical protein
MKRTLSTNASKKNSSKSRKTNNQSPLDQTTNSSDENNLKSRKTNDQSPLDLLIEMIIENGNEKDEVTIDEAFQIIVKDEDDIINAKCRDKVKN